MLSEAGAWQALHQVMDPEVPVLSVCDLGIVREVSSVEGAVEVTLTPTYSGCPATKVIEQAVREALLEAGATDVRVHTRLAPPWTTDWLSEDAKTRLRAHGIAPPGGQAGVHVLRFQPACPRCGSRRTEQLSAFGATACKALHRCLDCREPFEYFKPL